MPTVAALLRAFDDGRDRAAFYREWRMRLHAGLAFPTIPRPDLLEPFEKALLTLGEESGKLEDVLTALIEYRERQHRLTLKVKKWLSYPMFVSLCAVMIGPLPLIFIRGTTAYLTTAITGFVLWVFVGGAVFAGMAERYKRRPAFVRARLARALATAIEAGLPLGSAARLAADGCGDADLGARIRRSSERTLNSQPLSVTLPPSPLITPEFFTTLQMAEQTGDYTNTLRKLATLYEDGFK